MTDHTQAAEELLNKIGHLNVEESGLGDNLGIALVSYFEEHLGRPDPDPQTEQGWGEWATKKTNEAIGIIAAFVEEQQEAALRAARKQGAVDALRGMARQLDEAWKQGIGDGLNTVSGLIDAEADRIEEENTDE